mgnify:CR=1 FL=1
MMMDWSPEFTFWIAQAFGLIGLCLGIISLQMKAPRHIIMADTSLAGAWVVNYALMGGVNGAIMCCVAIIRGLLVLITPKHLIVYAYLAIISAIWGFGSMHITHWVDILPCLGMSVFTTAFFWVKDRAVMVRIMMAGSLLWLGYAISVGTLFPILSILMNMTSNVIGMARYEGWFRSKTPTLQAAE